MTRVLLTCALLCVVSARAEDFSWFDEVQAAPDAAARRAVLEKHRAKLGYGTVKGIARVAEQFATEARGLTTIELAEAIAEVVGEERGRAYAARMRGHIAVLREDYRGAREAFERAIGFARAGELRGEESAAQAWAALCAWRLDDRAGAVERFTASRAELGRTADMLAAVPPGLELLTGWAARRRADLEEDVQRWPAAEFWYRQAADAYQRAGLDLPLAEALDRAGLISYYQSKLDQAEELYRQSLAAAQRAGNDHQVGRAHLGFAEIAIDRARFDQVLAELDAAVPYLTRAESHVDLARVYYLRASARQSTGRHDQVEAELVLAEEQYRLADSAGGLADCQFVRGTNWLLLGDRARAMNALEDAGRTYAETSNYLGQANVKLKQSHACRLVGLDQRAKALAEEALDLYRMVHDRVGEANCLRALARLASRAADAEAAEKLNREAMDIYTAIGDRLGEAAARWQIGVAMKTRGADAAPTIEMLLSAMNLYQEIGDQHGAALPALELGELIARHGDAGLAYKAFSKALALGEASGSRATIAAALHHLGRLAEALQPPKLELAAELYRQAIDVVEEMRERAGEQEARQGLQAAYLDYYEALIRVLLKLHQAAPALHVAESARARTVLELVADAGVNLSAGMSVAQRAQEAAKAWALTRANVALGRLLAAPEADEQALATARQEVLTTRRDLEDYRASLYRGLPELRRRRGEPPVQAADLAADLTADTALIEYCLGTEESVAFVVTAAGEVRVTAVTLKVTAQQAWELADAFRSACANPRRRYAAPGGEAYDALVAPVLEQVPAGVGRLVIVPDQALFELPFQALPAGDGCLWDKYRISYAASASLLHQIRGTPKPETTGLLAFANPHFGPLVRSPELERGTPLAQLPGAAAEVAALAGCVAGPTLVLAGREATEDQAKQQLGDYRLIHFATHGILDSGSPLYSAVILAEPGPDSLEDGQLEARELADLRLRADLVTLSACETGRGKVQPGEGLLGLSWALTAAGARSQVVSYWKVSDESTRDLMVGFYRRLNDGEGKSDALRAAAFAVREKSRHPFYWAPFVLIGEG